MAHPSDIHQRVPSTAVASGGGSLFENAASGNRISAASSSVSADSFTSSSSSHHSPVSMNIIGGGAWSAEERGITSFEKNPSLQFTSENKPVRVAKIEGKQMKVNVEKSKVPSPSQSHSAAASPDTSGGAAGFENLILPLPQFPIAEFLFQLTKMLMDKNSDYIEWRNASICVHDPPGLERDILPNYYRHSNYSSFQRQMNYFGFRKIAGKGKMAPCSYVNELATGDISSLLSIKRKKAGISSAAAKLIAQQHQITRSLGGFGSVDASGSSLEIMGYSSGGVGGELSMGEISKGVPLNDQQMFAQLQHAHLLPLANTGIQATQNKMFNDLNVGTGGFTGGSSTISQSGSSLTERHLDNFDRFDSAANLRALINQQIAMFNTPGDSSPPSTMNGIGGLGNQLPLTGLVHGQAQVSLPNASARMYGLNDILQLSASMGLYNDTIDTNRCFPQLEQQLLQGSTSAEPSHHDLSTLEH